MTDSPRHDQRVRLSDGDLRRIEEALSQVARSCATHEALLVKDDGSIVAEFVRTHPCSFCRSTIRQGEEWFEEAIRDPKILENGYFEEMGSSGSCVRSYLLPLRMFMILPLDHGTGQSDPDLRLYDIIRAETAKAIERISEILSRSNAKCGPDRDRKNQ